jgi:ribose transport system permease protein
MKDRVPETTLSEKISRNRAVIIRYGSLVLVLLLFLILSDGEIFSLYNIRSLLGQTAPLLIISVGLVFIFSHGGFDISAGAVVGLCCVVITAVMNMTDSVPVALLASVLVSAALYAFNWAMTVKIGLMSAISSLAIFFIARGAVTYISSLYSGNLGLVNYGAIAVFKNNMTWHICMILFASGLCVFLFNYTKLGKYAKAIGGNPLSAEQSGADVSQVKLLCYLLAGMMVGVASVFVLARAGTVSKNIGAGMEMDVMVALILGGMNLNGGARARVSAAITGSFTYKLLANGLTMAGVSQNYISVAKGLLFLFIVTLTLRQSKAIKELPR